MAKNTNNGRAEEAGLSLDTIEYFAGGRGSVDFTGFSVRLAGDALITLRGVMEDGTPGVAFFGAASLGTAVIKLAAAVRSGEVEWKVDRFR